MEGIFVVFVFLSHFGQYEAMPWNEILLAIGQLMVAPFLFYSGYGIMEQIQKRGDRYIDRLMLVLALALYLVSLPILAYEVIAGTLCFLIVDVCAHKEIKNSLFHFLGQYVFEIYILQRISMNLFNGYLTGWFYLITCILVTLILAYCFKKLETIIDSYIF